MGFIPNLFLIFEREQAGVVLPQGGFENTPYFAVYDQVFNQYKIDIRIKESA